MRPSGLIVGGVLTEYASWRWCLGVNVPVALIVAGAAFPLVHESKAHGNTSYDIPGVLMASVGLVSLVYGFTEAAKAKHPEDPTDTSVLGWGHSTTILFLLVAVVLLVGFVLWENRSTEPLAAVAGHPGPQPRRLLPGVPVGRGRACSRCSCS